MQTGSYQAGNVRHIHHQIGAHLMGDIRKGFEVNDAGIGGSAGNDHLGLVLVGQLPHLIIVDTVGHRIDTIGDHMIVLAGEVDRRAMGQMSALIQVHAHDGVAQLAQRLIDRIVGLCAGMRLNIGKIPGNLLHNVHILTAAIVTLAGVALRILIGQYASGSHQYGGTDNIFRGDQLNIAILTLIFLADCCTNLRIGS